MVVFFQKNLVYQTEKSTVSEINLLYLIILTTACHSSITTASVSIQCTGGFADMSGLESSVHPISLKCDMAAMLDTRSHAGYSEPCWILGAMLDTRSHAGYSEPCFDHLTFKCSTVVYCVKFQGVYFSAVCTFVRSFKPLRKNKKGWLITCNHVVRHGVTARTMWSSAALNRKWMYIRIESGHYWVEY